MIPKASRLYVCLVLFTLLMQHIPVHAQQGAVNINDYLQPGERTARIQPALRYDRHLYEIHYFTTSDYTSQRAGLIFSASAQFFAQKQITALLVTEDGNLVDDEDTLRRVFTLYRSAVELFDYQVANAPGLIDDSFVDDMVRVTNSPLFLGQYFKHAIFGDRTAETTEALRSILTAYRASPDTMTDFADQIRIQAETTNSFDDAVREIAESARFSNNKAVRDVAKDLRATFKSWERSTEQGRSFIKINGQRIELFNALDVLSLSAHLLWLANFERDRADWLKTYLTYAQGDATLDADQGLAAAAAIVETESDWVQRGNIILQFVADKTSDLAIDLGKKALADLWVKWSWQEFGKRSTGHLVAGAASAVLLGFTLGNLILGLDDLYNNFITGERADELRRRFRSARLQLQPGALRTVAEYDGEMAARFQVAYMLESLSAVSEYRSYADGVDATVRQNLFALINPVVWFRGKEWSEATRQLREVANQIELNAENTIGHPEFVDAAVKLVTDRLALGATLPAVIVDDAEAGCVKMGNASFWHSTSAGHAGGAIWTFNESQKTTNSVRWIPALRRSGSYQLHAFIPAHPAQLPKPFTQAARYSIHHAGADNIKTASQAGANNEWLDLGTYYFSGKGDEYIGLVDQTGEPSGSTIVAFDALRWTAVNRDIPALDASATNAFVYDIVLPGETASLEFHLQNTGAAPWNGSEHSLEAQAGDFGAAPRSLPVVGQVSPGETATWNVNFVVSGSPGVRRFPYRMQFAGQPFGQVVTGYVFVVPEALKDMEAKIRGQIEDWKRQGQKTIDDLVQGIWQEIQREIERQAQRAVGQLCQGTGVLLAMVLLIGCRGWHVRAR